MVKSKVVSPASHDGITREVVISEKVVLKMPSLEYGGRDQCLSEGRFWDRVKDDPDAKYFAKVIAYDPHGAWVLQEKVTPVQGCLTDEQWREIGRVCRKFAVRDQYERAWTKSPSYDHAEYKIMDNIVLTAAGPVIIDYGCS